MIVMHAGFDVTGYILGNDFDSCDGWDTPRDG
jgi:hypothetical protein